MRIVLVALALVACKAKPKSEPAATAPAATPQPTVAAPRLPGALYFQADGALVRLADGAFAEVDDAGAQVFPSAHALPDGRIVGIASAGDGEAGSEQLVLIAGTKVARFGPAATQVRSPAVDPAGQWIVIEAKLEPQSQLYRIELAGGEPKQLTTDPQGNYAPAALGSQAIAFASSRDGDSELYRLDLETGKQQRLTAFHRDDWAPVPSPDGETLAFLSDREGMPRIFLLGADGTQLRRLTARGERDAEEDQPVWSPDGKMLAYTVVVVGKSSHVVVRDVASGAERVVTPPGARDADPVFSPDGAYVAVVRQRDKVSDLWAVPVRGDGAPIQITATPASELLPRWFR